MLSDASVGEWIDIRVWKVLGFPAIELSQLMPNNFQGCSEKRESLCKKTFLMLNEVNKQ